MANEAERLIVTFAVGGPLRYFYMDLHVRPGENDSPYSYDHIIREWCSEHFPHDWASTYTPEEFQPQIEKYGLTLLRAGRIERLEGRNIFHEAME